MTEHIAPRVTTSVLRDDQCSLIKPAHLNDTLIATPSTPREPEKEVVISPPIIKPNISDAEEHQPRTLDAVPEELVEYEHVSEEVTAKVVTQPEETAQSFTAQPLDPEREVSDVSRDCIRLGNQLSEHYRKPYGEFFHEKPKDAWSSSDSYTWGWGSKDKCYLPQAAWTERGARENREPMIAYCNCMMDLWNKRNPAVQATEPAQEVDETVQVEELPAHEELESVEEPQIYPNISIVPPAFDLT